MPNHANLRVRRLWSGPWRSSWCLVTFLPFWWFCALVLGLGYWLRFFLWLGLRVIVRFSSDTDSASWSPTRGACDFAPYCPSLLGHLIVFLAELSSRTRAATSTLSQFSIARPNWTTASDESQMRTASITNPNSISLLASGNFGGVNLISRY